MKDQHTKIKGYRDLSQTEIDLMNEIKAFGPQFEALIEKVHAHLDSQRAAADGNFDEIERMRQAEPKRWTSISRTHLQEGLMALTRAIAQPTFF